MRAASKVLSTAVAALGLAVFLPVSSRAGTITIVDGANDIISFIDTTGRLNITGCPGAETSACSFTIAGPDGSVPAVVDNSAISLLEPGLLTSSSDNLSLTNTLNFGGTTWSFFSDTETGLTILPNAFTLTEDGTAQLVATITYHSVTGSVIDTDQIFIQSDVEPIPEPASASLLLLGGGLLIAAGRLRKRVRR